MIVREYYQNINTRSPRNYFERWYADVWDRRVGRPTAPPGTLEKLLEEELAHYSATLGHKDNGYRYVVTFKNDSDYTHFVLRWA